MITIGSAIKFYRTNKTYLNTLDTKIEQLIIEADIIENLNDEIIHPQVFSPVKEIHLENCKLHRIQTEFSRI
jgi:hypothetical protein